MYDCSHPRTEIRIRTYSNGSQHYHEQCLTCGASTGVYKKDSPEVEQARSGGIEEWDNDLEGYFYESRRADWEAQRDEINSEKRAKYREYLNSPEWQEKRLMALKRDNYLCQGCLQKRATQVHHLTYKNFGNELLFQLVSLCRKCHLEVAHGN